MIFKDPEFEAFFKQYGYVAVPLISQEALSEVLNLYESSRDDSGLDSNFYTSIWSDNRAYKEQVDRELKRILKPFLEKHFKTYQTAFANFMVKKSGYSSSLQPHQDWTFVKEPENYSITVWIPLMDVTEENGALEVLPGSNNLDNYVRARFMNSPFSAHNKFIEEHLMKSIPLKKGEALLVNSRTIHASPDNLSGVDRVAASIVVYPESTSLLHYVSEKGQELTVDALDIDASFFVKYSCFENPSDEKAVTKVNIEAREVSLEKLKNL